MSSGSTQTDKDHKAWVVVRYVAEEVTVLQTSTTRLVLALPCRNLDLVDVFFSSLKRLAQPNSSNSVGYEVLIKVVVQHNRCFFSRNEGFFMKLISLSLRDIDTIMVSSCRTCLYCSK